MRRASIVAVLTVLTVLLLATGCGSGSDDESADDSDRPTDSSSSAGSDSTSSTDEESETSDGATPTESGEPTEPTAPPAANHDPAKPTVATKKRVPSDICGMLTAQDLVAADFGTVQGSQPMPDGGCAAESASGRFEGVVYGVSPAEPGGKAPSGPMKIEAYDLDGNTAFWGCYPQASTCTAAVALGADSWAAVHVASANLAQQRADAIKTAKKLLKRMFDGLPNA